MALFGWRKSRACKHEDKRVSKLGAADKTSPAVNSKCSSNGCTRYSSGRDSHTQVAPAVATSVIRHPSSICSAHPSQGHTQTNSHPISHSLALMCRSVHSGRGHRSREGIKPTTFCHHNHHHQGGGSDAPFAAPSDL